MATIDEKIKKLESKLKQEKAKKQKMEAQKKAALTKAARAAQTRKKILGGAFLEFLEKKYPEYVPLVQPDLNEFFKRDDDRALFGLPPLQEPEAPAAPSRSEAGQLAN